MARGTIIKKEDEDERRRLRRTADGTQVKKAVGADRSEAQRRAERRRDGRRPRRAAARPAATPSPRPPIGGWRSKKPRIETSTYAATKSISACG